MLAKCRRERERASRPVTAEAKVDTASVTTKGDVIVAAAGPQVVNRKSIPIGDDAHAPIGSIVPICETIDSRVGLLWIEDVEPHGSGAQHGWDSHLLVLFIQREDQRAIAGVPESIIDLLLQSLKFPRCRF